MCSAKAKRQRLLLFAFDSLLPSSTGRLAAMQRQTAGTAYFSGEQLLLLDFAGYVIFILIDDTR